MTGPLPNISVRAEQDVNELADYIGADDPAAALRFFDAVEETYRGIAAHPLRHPTYPAGDPKLPDLRKRAVVGFRNYLVFYRAGGDVRIERVLHASRDLVTELADT